MRSITAMAVATALTICALLPQAAAAVSLGANIGSARVNGGDFDGSDTSWKLHIGSSYQDVIGGEIGYVNFGRLGGDGPKAHAWAPAITVGLPLGLARIYGKGGVAFADVEGSSIREEAKSNKPFYGVGLRFGVTPGLGFRAEYERYRFEREDIDMAMAGLELNF